MEKCWFSIKYIVYKSSSSKVGMGITTTLIKKSYLLKSMLKSIVINWVYYVAIGKRKNKLVQFFVCFHILCDNKLITRVWTRWCISLISKTFQKHIGQHNWLKDASCTCMSWLSTKPKFWLRLLGSFPSCVMKIDNKLFCCYPCNRWLMAPLLIILWGFWWMSLCFLVIDLGNNCI
jgi:hypothetical protein